MPDEDRRRDRSDLAGVKHCAEAYFYMVRYDREKKILLNDYNLAFRYREKRRLPSWRKDLKFGGIGYG